MQQVMYSKILTTLVLLAGSSLVCPTPVMASDYGGVAKFIVFNSIALLIMVIYAVSVVISLYKMTFKAPGTLLGSLALSILASVPVLLALSQNKRSLIDLLSAPSLDFFWLLACAPSIMLCLVFLAPVVQFLILRRRGSLDHNSEN